MPIQFVPCFIDFDFSVSVGENTIRFQHHEVPARLDFHERKFIARINVRQLEAIALSFRSECIKLKKVVFQTRQRCFSLDLDSFQYIPASNAAIAFHSRMEKQQFQTFDITFRFHAKTLKFVSAPKNETEKKLHTLVFSGARNFEFRQTIDWHGQSIVAKSEADSPFLNLHSDTQISDDFVQLFSLAFSLFQNAEIRLFESYCEDTLILYVQTPPHPCVSLIHSISFFPCIMDWLERNDYYKHAKNRFSYYFSGARLHDDYLELKISQLFLCMNVICGNGGRFGLHIAKYFHLVEGDGIWLSYVRNNMVHEGLSLDSAIENACDDFNENQVPRGKELFRYSDILTYPVEKRALRVYTDVVNLIYAYFMEKAGYPNPFLLEKKKTCVDNDKTEDEVAFTQNADLPPLPLASIDDFL